MDLLIIIWLDIKENCFHWLWFHLNRLLPRVGQTFVTPSFTTTSSYVFVSYLKRYFRQVHLGFLYHLSSKDFQFVHYDFFHLGFDKLARLYRRRLCVRRVEAGLQVRAQGVQGHVHPEGGIASN